MFDGLTKMLAANKLVRKLLPNHTYNMYTPIGRQSNQKRVLPKHPNVRQLRNFSHDPIVRRAISVVQDAVSRLPYRITVIGEDEGQYDFAKEQITACIEQPNVIDTRGSFTKRIIDDALVLDAMCAEVVLTTRKDHPVYMYPVDGSTIQMVVPYDYTNIKAARYAQQQSDGMKYFTAEDVAYLQRQYFTYQPYGLSPILSAYNYIRYLLDSVERAEERANNATSEFLINLGEGITEKQREQFTEYMLNEIEGTGHIPVVAGSRNIETKQIRAINKDGLYLDWIRQLTQIVGVAFGIPPQKLGILIANDRNTGEDVESAMMQDLIKPYVFMIEDLYNKWIIDKMGYGGKLRLEFVIEDSEYQKVLKSKRVVDEYYKGIITENEVRELMGYERSDKEYADMTSPEKLAHINVDLGIAGGFNGVGNIKDTSDSKE